MRAETNSGLKMTEELTETAKAAQEVAKVAGKGIDLAQSLGGWFDGRLTAPLDATIAWALTDRVIEAREANRIRIRDRLLRLAHQTQSRLEADGVVAIEAPSDRLLSGLIDGASLEDDPTIQDMWATLMANALQGTDQDALHWVTILRDLRPVEAAALAAYYAGVDEVVLSEFVAGKTRMMSLNGEAFGLAVTRSLNRLGLVEPVSAMVAITTGAPFDFAVPETAEVEYSGGLYQVQLTETGIGFCRAVGLPAPPPAKDA